MHMSYYSMMNDAYGWHMMHCICKMYIFLILDICDMFGICNCVSQRMHSKDMGCILYVYDIKCICMTYNVYV